MARVSNALSPWRVLFQRREIPRLRSVSLGMTNRARLIHIALVTLVALELLNVFVGLINALTALLLYDFSQGSHRHPLPFASRRRTRKSAHPRCRSISKFRPRSPSFVLDVDLLGLIARPGAIESCERSFLQIDLEFVSIRKIAALVLCAEEEPVFTFGPRRLSLL